MGESAAFNLRSADRNKPARPHFHDRASKEFPGLCAFEHSLKISQTFSEIGLGLGLDERSLSAPRGLKQILPTAF